MEMNYSQLAAETIEYTAFLSRETLKLLPRGAISGEMGILLFLIKNTDGMGAGQISRCMNVSTGRVASVLKNLEKKKLIVRKKDGIDKRKIMVVITDEGKKQALEHYDKILNSVENILRLIGEEDAIEAARLLKKIAELVKVYEAE